MESVAHNLEVVLFTEPTNAVVYLLNGRTEMPDH